MLITNYSEVKFCSKSNYYFEVNQIINKNWDHFMQKTSNDVSSPPPLPVKISWKST